MNGPSRIIPHLSFALPLVLASVVLSSVVLAAALQPTTRPGGRSCFSATAASADGVVIWGGARACGVDVVRDSSLWVWNGKAWLSRAGPPIEPRDDALLLSGPSEGVLTLFGGRREGKAFDDLWVYERMVWRQLAPQGGPGPIQHGAAALDSRRKRIVVFGGAVGSSMSRKTYEWDGTRWHEFDLAGPAPRVGHGMAWSERDGGVLLYGGFADKQFRDLWRWDGANWKLLSSEGPTYTEGAVIAEADRGIYVIGPGLESGAQSNVRVWQWNGEAFVASGAARPPLRVGAAAVYDRTRRVLVLWGGNAGSGEADATLWEFNGRQWSESSR